MKIDLHCHTKKVKIGDPTSRTVSKELFSKKIIESEVKIVAITNHNHFDYDQYKDLKKSVNDFCDVWPGIELDIEGKINSQGISKRGHLIVIANPKNHRLFHDRVSKLIGGQNPDEYIIDVKSVFHLLDECDVLYIPHFHKEPELAEEDIEELNDLLGDKSRLFKETSDYRSLGVFSNFDYSVIIGSDVKDWDIYEKSKFAEIRLPIQTFEQFCLLAKKDKQIIDTLLIKKLKSNVVVEPYKNTCVTIPIYEDVNIIFGQKGTGKSEIISSLRSYYENLGINSKSYIGSSKDTDFKLLLDVSDVKRDPAKLGLSDMRIQFKSVFDWKDSKITPITRYIDWWETKDNNRNKKNMKITNCAKLINYPMNPKSEKDYNIISEFSNSSFSDLNFDDYLDNKDIVELEFLLDKLQSNIVEEKLKQWQEFEKIKLLNWSTDKIKDIADKCSNTVSKPSTTGFVDFALNRFDLFRATSDISNALEKKEVNESQLLGSIEDKGDIYIQTKYRMLGKKSKTSEFESKITDLRAFATIIGSIRAEITFDSVGEKIANFREYYENGLNDISKFIGISKDTVWNNGAVYKPSNGERGILLMQKLLDSDCDIYLMDEPELGMGNSYITASILPKIQDIVKRNKTIIIATHNANLAVGTLPYISILRTHDNGVYKTYTGNAFCDELRNLEDDSDILNWTNESMHTLEGGVEAFYERRDIYESGK